MKNIHPSRKSLPPALQGILLSLLLSGIIAWRAFAAGDASAAPAPKAGATPFATAAPIMTGSSEIPTPDIPATGVSVSAGGSDPGVVAQIGDANVTVEDMRATIATIDPSLQAAAAADPAYLEKVVRTLLMERVVMKEILAKKWDDQPDVKARLEKMRETALTDMYLRAISKPPDDYPSDAELHAAYEAHKTEFNVPHDFLLSQVFVAVPIDAGTEASNKALHRLDGIIKELQKPGADFAAIAKSESDDKLSAQQGGEMGWVNDDKMAPRIRSMSHILSKGDISSPVRLADGWHILKLLDSKDISPAPFDIVKTKLAQALRVQREHENRIANLNKILAKYPVTINDEAIPYILNKPK